MVGLLWAAWHLPVYFLPTFASENGGLSLTSIGVFGLSAIAFAIIMTWVFNHTRGSLLIAMLIHASLNTFQGYANGLFPTQANSEVHPLIGLVGLAILIVIITRSQLGYAAYQRNHQR